MNFDRAPDAEAAITLLREMVQVVPHCGPRLVNKPLSLYGAGDLGRMAKEYFERLHIAVEYVVDARAADHRTAPFWQDVPVLFPEEVTAEQRARDLLAVCVVKIPYVPLSDQLTTQGWKDVVPFYDIAEAYRDRHPLSNGWFADPISSSELEFVAEVLARWDDNISRAHHLQFIAWRLSRQEWSFADAPVTTDDRFFVPEVLNVLGDKESFADIGAHHGQVTMRFLDTVTGQFEKVWMVEPDTFNIRRLNEAVSASKDSERNKIHILASTVSDRVQSRKFHSGLGYASQLSDLGQDTVETTTVDQLGLSPSFMKLHLEGAELEVLKGAEKTMKAFRPIVVATTYHNKDGLWKLPAWLMNHLEGYVFKMRMHSWCGTGSVIYAIPQERLNGTDAK